MSDRYKFLKNWTDPESGKTFTAGNVVRMSPGQSGPLVENGTLMQVADFTICRKDIFAPGSCQPVSEAQAAAYTGENKVLKDNFAGTSLAKNGPKK